VKSSRFVVLGAACALLSLALPPVRATGAASAARAAPAPASGAGGAACRASAPSRPQATSKLRHVPDEDDPCAGTRGAKLDGPAMPESLRRARAASGKDPASAPVR